MASEDDLIYCPTCRRFTLQIVLKEMEDWAIKNGQPFFQKLFCTNCKRTNERLLQFCSKCQTHTNQKLIEEKPSTSMEDTVNQIFKCLICGESNKTSRDSDEYIQRLRNRKDEEGGVECKHCLCKKLQTIINKQPSIAMTGYDLTTYRCKTCGEENYGREKRRDIR